MRVSELQPAAYPQSPSVEKPNSDAHALFTNDFNKNSFIEANGDVEIVWNERYKYWEVPAFAEGSIVGFFVILLNDIICISRHHTYLLTCCHRFAPNATCRKRSAWRRDGFPVYD